MKVRVKLIATYLKLLPVGAQGHTIEVEVLPDATVEQVMAQFNVPMDESSVIVLNGFTVALDTPLSDGDIISAFSAIAGG